MPSTKTPLLSQNIENPFLLMLLTQRSNEVNSFQVTHEVYGVSKEKHWIESQAEV
jgi:hypothetical protein